MSTTTLKLPADLKARIAPLAEAAGKTAHAWMVEALQAQVALADLRREFVEDARRSAAEVDAGGPVFAMEEVAAYLRGRLVAGRAKRPAPLSAAVGKGRRRSGKSTV